MDFKNLKSLDTLVFSIKSGTAGEINYAVKNDDQVLSLSDFDVYKNKQQD